MKHVFCIDGNVWSSMSEEEIRATVVGLKEMGLYRLPYDEEIVLRVMHGGDCYNEINGLSGGECTVDVVIRTPKSETKLAGFTLEREENDGTKVDALADAVKLPVTIEGKQAIHRWRMKPKDWSDAERRDHYCDGLITLLATKGLEKKSRKSKLSKLGIGKRTSEYTTKINLSPSVQAGNLEEAEPGQPVRPHLRRGHIRRQHYGERNLLVKQIWIDPVIVNADQNFISKRTAYRIH